MRPAVGLSPCPHRAALSFHLYSLAARTRTAARRRRCRSLRHFTPSPPGVGSKSPERSDESCGRCSASLRRFVRDDYSLCVSSPHGLSPFNAGVAAHGGGRGQRAVRRAWVPRGEPQHMTPGVTAQINKRHTVTVICDLIVV